jgi:hypothetical protein
MAKQILHYVERMFDVRANLRLGSLQLREQLLPFAASS